MKIVIFDFDATLVHSPLPNDAIPIWEKKTKMAWPYEGFWSKAESLNLDVFHIPLNMWVYNKYLEHKKEENTKIFLATGRLKKLEKHVRAILDYHDVEFDGVYCNTGGETYNFKSRLFENLIKEHKATELIMYDDRHLHLKKFQIWRNGIDCEIKIVDVINKKFI